MDASIGFRDLQEDEECEDEEYRCVTAEGGEMWKTIELHAEIVENDAGDIVMRLKDYGKGAITFHRASGASGPKAYKKLKAILDQAPPKQTAGSP